MLITPRLTIVNNDAYKVNQAARILATSNSREILRLLQRYRATGNTPQQTQGAVLSSEEMSPSQFFTGLLIPGMQGALLPSGQAEPPPEGGEELLPAGQAGSNPEGTAAGIQKVFPTTIDGLSEIPDELYPTPSGFRQPEVGTSGMFVQPTVDISMEPSELREPPTSLVKLDLGNMQGPHNLSQPLVRGDSHIPVNTVASKPLNVP
ncbi:uncharacterized protein PHA67_006665 [Liasis olivaceus]